MEKFVYPKPKKYNGQTNAKNCIGILERLKHVSYLDNTIFMVYTINTVTGGRVSLVTLKVTLRGNSTFFIIIKRPYSPQEDIEFLVKNKSPERGFCF